MWVDFDEGDKACCCSSALVSILSGKFFGKRLFGLIDASLELIVQAVAAIFIWICFAISTATLYRNDDCFYRWPIFGDDSIFEGEVGEVGDAEEGKDKDCEDNGKSSFCSVDDGGY